MLTSTNFKNVFSQLFLCDFKIKKNILQFVFWYLQSFTGFEQAKFLYLLNKYNIRNSTIKNEFLTGA